MSDSSGPATTVLVGAPGQILAMDFSGTSFQTVANSTEAGTAPSWMIFKEPNLLYAVDENSNTTRLFHFDPRNRSLSAAPVSSAEGSLGVVDLAFNSDQTRMLGASYSLGQVDVWDVSAADGSMRLMKQVALQGPIGSRPEQGQHRAHQVVPHPGGRFFFVNDLGGDSIHVLDGQDDAWTVAAVIQVSPSGAGPRHGAFIGDGYYAVACELSSQVLLFSVEVPGQPGQGSDKADAPVTLMQVQTLSTFGAAFPPANATSAAAGELVVSRNQRDVYVSNRLTGNATDSISHFAVADADVVCGSSAGGSTGTAKQLCFRDQVSSGGLMPRMFSLGGAGSDGEETLLFSSNQGGDGGLLAFRRSADTGSLNAAPVATFANADVSPETGFGPQFIMEISIS